MSDDHPEAPVFAFTEDRHTRVFLCAHVARGAPALYVSHDADGDWQFLCGGVHDPEGADEPVLESLEHVVARDPSLNALAALCTNHHAERASPTAEWVITDDAEGFIRTAVEKHGWAVQLIAQGAQGEPAFAYTVGLFKSFGQPELIVFGLPQETMRDILNDLGALARGGSRLTAGDAVSDILEGYDVRLREVTRADSYRQHVGYARWFYAGAPFPLCQVLWPDRSGRFPGEAGAAAFLATAQPLLP